MKLFLAIAVGNPEGNLGRIPGAHRAARDLSAWARQNGYHVLEATDEVQPVSVATIASLLTPVLQSPANDFERIIVAFAGHGVSRDAADEFWLLSQWKSGATEAIEVGPFRQRLRTYQPRQITLIGDACRTLPTSEARNLRGSPIIPTGPYPPRTVHIDQALATEFGDPAYATPASAADQYCFLSYVAALALWGEYPEARDGDGPEQVVTSQSLMNAIETHVSRIAETYNKTQSAECNSGFRAPDNVYTRLGQHGVAPSPPSLPPPTPVDPAGPIRPPNDTAEALRVRERGRWLKFMEPALNIDLEHPLSGHFRNRTQLVEVLAALDNGEEGRIGVVGDDVVRIQLASARPLIRSTARPLWSPLQGQADADLALVELATSGAFAVAPLLRDMGVVLSISDDPNLGVAGMRFFPMGRMRIATPDIVATARLLDEALARLNSGTLQTADVYDISAVLRRGKHDDPVLGVIAAHLYAGRGDIASIRDLAWWFASGMQPVPFDIALLADAEISGPPGDYRIHLPPLERRQPRTDEERRRPHLFDARDAATGVIGGAAPMLRQGWSLLAAGPPAFRPLAAFANDLLPAPFSTLRAEAGARFLNFIRQRG